MTEGVKRILYQILGWLKSGAWNKLPAAYLFLYLDPDFLSIIEHMQWKGIQKIVIWLLDRPLSLILFLCGFFGVGLVKYNEP